MRSTRPAPCVGLGNNVNICQHPGKLSRDWGSQQDARAFQTIPSPSEGTQHHFWGKEHMGTTTTQLSEGTAGVCYFGGGTRGVWRQRSEFGPGARTCFSNFFMVPPVATSRAVLPSWPANQGPVMSVLPTSLRSLTFLVFCINFSSGGVWPEPLH